VARTKKNSQSIAERFWACVPDRPADGCWLWAGYRARGRTDRYGRLGIGKRPEGAHRISLAEMVVPYRDPSRLVRVWSANPRGIPVFVDSRMES
jgi:hypothetical protein